MSRWHTPHGEVSGLATGADSAGRVGSAAEPVSEALVHDHSFVLVRGLTDVGYRLFHRREMEIRQMATHESEVLGVDIGGVIIDRVSEDDQSYAEAPAVEGAFEAVTQLVQQRFREHVWLVSRCEKSREPVLLEWLAQHDFFGLTGVNQQHVRFCRQRHDKATICRQLGATHFIDDRLEVLSHLVGTVPHLYLLQSRAEGMERFRQFIPHVHLVTGWSEIVDAVLSPR